MFTVPNVTLMNIMACRVFRNTKFGIFRGTYKHSHSATMSIPNRADGPAIPLSLVATKPNGPDRVASDTTTFHANMYGVEITKTVEHLHDRDYSKERDMEHQ